MRWDQRLKSKLTNWLLKERGSASYALCDFERLRYELRPCDVLLVEGRSPVSDVIRMITQSPWTHSALYLGKLHEIDDPLLRERVAQSYEGSLEEELLIEGMLGQGTIVSPLSQYKNDHLRLCRPSGISRQDAQDVMAYCVRKLGTHYDVRHIFDLARFFLPWGILPRRWRSSIFSHHPGSYTKTVCSTILAEAFASVSFPILPAVLKDEGNCMNLVHRNPRLTTPKDFDYSPFFSIIKYPFLNVVEQGIYKQLPWKNNHCSNDQHGVIHLDDLPQHPDSLKETV